MVENWLSDLKVSFDMYLALSQHDKEKIDKLMMQSEAREKLAKLELMNLEYTHAENLMQTCFIPKDKLSKGTSRNFQSLSQIITAFELKPHVNDDISGLVQEKYLESKYEN